MFKKRKISKRQYRWANTELNTFSDQLNSSDSSEDLTSCPTSFSSNSNIQDSTKEVLNLDISENVTNFASTSKLLSENVLYKNNPPFVSENSEENSDQSNNINSSSDESVFECSLECLSSSKKKDFDEGTNINSQLASWATNHKIPQNALNSLLKILKSVPALSTLPNDSRTLLKSPRDIVLKTVEPGKYYHFSLETELNRFFEKTDIIDFITNNTIELCINIDGIPISKSSGSQLYPILFNFFKFPKLVGIIGIYHGYQKPNNSNDLLREFVDECVILIDRGYIFKGVQYKLIIRALICDAPAKSFVLYTTGHTGYYSCSKCFVKGEYRNNRICFPDANLCSERSDMEFRQQVNAKHHLGVSVLEQLPQFDMVQNVVLDYMHLICLGVMRKLLFLWCFDFKSGSKLSKSDITKISDFLLSQQSYTPCEFNRKPRSLLELKRWKATEYRQFLFYTGPVILNSVLISFQYKIFLALCTACIILSTDKFKAHIHIVHP